jgi:hypothetical protein
MPNPLRIRRPSIYLPSVGLAITLIVFSSASYSRAETDGVVGIFLGQAEPVLESYEAHRTLVGWSDGTTREARLEVRTAFDRAARALRYTVLGEEGSAIIRRRGLHAVLRAEAEAVKQGRMAQSALTPQNYDITASSVDETGLHRLLIHPRRADSLLVRGAMFVTGEGDLVRVEGQLAKRPSFWTTHVEVAREYARIAGITMLVRVQSKVKTRLFGSGGFLMTYTYQRVNGRQVDTQSHTARR